MARKYSKDIAAAINTFLKEDDWRYSFNEKMGLFKFGLNLHGKLRAVDYHIRVYTGDYIVYAASPIGADPKDSRMMQQMAEFVCRANYGLKCGNFELDMRDGEIRFKCYVSCEGNAVPTEEVIRESIYCPASMFDRYAPGILGIIFMDKEAKEMIDECENVRKGFRELMKELEESSDAIRSALAKASGRLGIATDSGSDGDEDVLQSAVTEAAGRIGISMDGEEEDADAAAPDTDTLDGEVLEALTDLLQSLEDLDAGEEGSDDDDADEEESGNEGEDEDGDGLEDLFEAPED